MILYMYRNSYYSIDNCKVGFFSLFLGSSHIFGGFSSFPEKKGVSKPSRGETGHRSVFCINKKKKKKRE